MAAKRGASARRNIIAVLRFLNVIEQDRFALSQSRILLWVAIYALLSLTYTLPAGLASAMTGIAMIVAAVANLMQMRTVDLRIFREKAAFLRWQATARRATQRFRRKK